MKYGTDGFRGPVDTHVTSEFCLKLGFHTGCLLKDKGYESVIIGKDTRVSGYMLESALQAGFISAGIDVKLAGPIPTPAVSFLTSTYSGQFGVVISASHNPFQDNGIKFFNRHGRKISEEFENLITEKVNLPIKPVPVSKLGKAFRIDSATGRYIEYCKSTLRGASNLRGSTILVDAAHGANYKITPMLLEELGAKVIRINCEPDGFNINKASAVLEQDKFKKYAEDLFLEKGPDHCLNILEKYYKEKIFPKDKQRLLSRLAFCLEYNDTMENNYGSKTPITPNSLVIQVTKPKKDLYEKAEYRFNQMINKGALDEVKSLYENKKISKTLYKAHGLPELLSCVRNKLSLDEAIYLGIKNTKRYIKRQFTWWNNQKFSQLNLRINYKKSFPKDSIENISIYLNEQ